jgi:hypothetical protein
VGAVIKIFNHRSNGRRRACDSTSFYMLSSRSEADPSTILANEYRDQDKRYSLEHYIVRNYTSTQLNDVV